MNVNYFANTEKCMCFKCCTYINKWHFRRNKRCIWPRNVVKSSQKDHRTGLDHWEFCKQVVEEGPQKRRERCPAERPAPREKSCTPQHTYQYPNLPAWVPEDYEDDQKGTAAAAAQENKESLSWGAGSQGQRGEHRFQKYLGGWLGRTH